MVFFKKLNVYLEQRFKHRLLQRTTNKMHKHNIRKVMPRVLKVGG